MVRKQHQASSAEFVSEIKTIDEKERTIVHTITSSTVDRYHDIVDPAGMKDKNYGKNPVVLFGHNSGGWGITDVSTIPIIGRSMWRKREGETIISKTEFTDVTDFAEDAWNLARSGFMKATSIGFMPETYEVTKLAEITDLNPPNRADFDPATEIVIWKTWELLEYSLVPIPANPDALQNALTEARSVRMQKFLEGLKKEQRLCELESCKESFEGQIQKLLLEIEQLKSLSTLDVAKRLEAIEDAVIEKKTEELVTTEKETPVETLAVQTLDMGSLILASARREVSRAKGKIID